MPNCIKSLLIAVIISAVFVTLSFIVAPIVSIFLPIRDGREQIWYSYVYIVPMLTPIFWLMVHGTLYPYNPNKQQVQNSNSSVQTNASVSEAVSKNSQINNHDNTPSPDTGNGNDSVNPDNISLYTTVTTFDTSAENNPDNNKPERNS